MSEVLETRFDVVRVLGEGSIGRVLLAREREGGRKVALRVLSETLVHSREARLAIRGEYLALERLRHPRLVEAYEYADVPGQPAYYAMEYVPGPDLSAAGPLEAGRAAQLLIQALEGLAFLHSRHTMHNDIRPENLRLADGGLKLLGFGLSGPAGTRPDMARLNQFCTAPEALRGARLDPRSDLFSLGAVFYQVLTGRVPYGFDRASNRGQAHLARPVMTLAELRPDLPAELADLVMRLMAGTPADRPPGAPAALAALANLGAETPTNAPAPRQALGSTGVPPAATAYRSPPQVPDLGLLLTPPLIGRSSALAELMAVLHDADAAKQQLRMRSPSAAASRPMQARNTRSVGHG